MDFFFCVKNISSFVADCFFFPTTKYPNVTRLAFDRAQVIIWVKFYATILTMHACSLKLRNEVPSNKFQTSLPQK